jgi:SAM-dependent methyltransferase
MTGTDGDQLHAVNTRIGQIYDELPYDPQANTGIDPERVLGAAALYGCAPAAGIDLDILDLGCGTGSQIARLATQTRGRLVGCDISSKACALARERCAAHGQRVRVVCADFLDLEAADLGQFDLIYHIGVIYVTPPPVRERILSLIAQCLKPDGVVVMSYYSGTQPLTRAALHRTLRAAVDTGPYDDMIRQARQRIEEIANLLPASGHRRDYLVEALQSTLGLTDTMFFHEVLNHAFDAMDTSVIEDAFREQGVDFFTYLTSASFASLPTSRARALAADALDFASGGGYWYSVYGKPRTTSHPPTPASPIVRWHSVLVRSVPTIAYAGPARFQLADADVPFDIYQPTTQAVLDELAQGPQRWPELLAAMRRRLSEHDVALTGQAEDQIADDMLTLWQHGALVPLWG